MFWKTELVNLIRILFIGYYAKVFAIKIINKEIKEKKLLSTIVFIILSIIDEIIRIKINFLFSMMVLIIFLSWYIRIVSKKEWNIIIVVTIISLVINYIIFIIAAAIVYLPNYFIKIDNILIQMSLIIIIYTQLIRKILKIKKIQSGFSFLRNELVRDYISILTLNICTIIIFSIVIFRECKDENGAMLLVGLLLIVIIMFLTIKKSFELYYKQKLLIKDLDETKEELAKTKEELAKAEKENLEASKRSHSLVHRQKALEFQISELRKSKNSKDINKIKQDVENLSKELYGKEVMTQLSKTNIELIDNMFRYMQFECYKNEIRFDLQICGNIYKMINNVINKETLEILLADHIKNAIIAVKHSENSNKSILVKLGKIGDYYGVCIYDSGIEFKEETLKTLGKKPSSTHLDEGGSGMGFLNTFDTLNKYKASLIIDEIGMPCEENYTKVIMIKFDGKNEFKVNSYRQQKAV